MQIDGRMHFGKWRRTQWADVMARIVDGDGYEYHTQYVQDVQPCIDHNTAVRNEFNGRTPDGARKVGSIPVTIVHDKIRQWHAEGRLDRNDPAYSVRLNQLLKDMLRDRDYSKFRTVEHV